MHQKLSIFTILSCLILGSGCWEIDEGSESFVPEEVTGLRPIYDNSEAAYLVSLSPPSTLSQPGRIYVKGKFLFINEKGKGIHILDNTDPSSPVYQSFINIPGNTNMAVKGDVFYVNNYRDLVAMRINDLGELNIVDRVKNVFPTLLEPERSGVYFECADQSKGTVIGWEEALLKKPQCYK